MATFTYSIGDRQTDILATQPSWYTIPRNAPGRLNMTDFIFFRWPKGLNASKYHVAIDTIDSNTPQKLISQLDNKVELPHVQLPWAKDGNVYVLPITDKLPAFRAPLSRASVYIIPETNGMNGYFEMERLGTILPPGV